MSVRMKKIFFISFIITLVTGAATSVNATSFNFNHSWLNPNLQYNNPTCGTTDPTNPTVTENTGTCCVHSTCTGTDASGHCFRMECDGGFIGITTKTYKSLVQVPRVNEYCYHPTCYYRAAAEVQDFPMPLQPLTNSAATIKTAVLGLTDRKVGAQLGTAFQYRYPHEFTLQPTGDKWTYLANLDYMTKWGVGTGTSAMQGLLWSWRVLSKNWQGVWGLQSDYETTGTGAALRSGANAVPNPSNSKHVIVISDGIDSDGPSYRNNTIPQALLNPANDGSLGLRRASNVDTTPIFETCDAHVPLASITYTDYVNNTTNPPTHPYDSSKPPGVCDRMKAQNVHVNVVLYLYPAQDITDSPLIACANMTEGAVYPNSTPATISQDLQDLIASIASHNIRLID